jgi:hypothetical protein
MRKNFGYLGLRSVGRPGVGRARLEVLAGAGWSSPCVESSGRKRIVCLLAMGLGAAGAGGTGAGIWTIGGSQGDGSRDGGAVGGHAGIPGFGTGRISQTGEVADIKLPTGKLPTGLTGTREGSGLRWHLVYDDGPAKVARTRL